MRRWMWVNIIIVIALVLMLTITTGSVRIILTGLLLIIYLTAFIAGIISPSLCLFVDSCRFGSRSGTQVALTFDDGPDEHSTPALLDMLARHHAKATFFLVGRKVKLFPQLTRRICSEGHLIANHTYSHSSWTNFLHARPLAFEIQRTQRLIRQVAGVTPSYYRPPMGLTNPHLLKALRRTGLQSVVWDVRVFDRRATPSRTIARVLKHTEPGSIILLHDGNIPSERLCTAVDGILTGLKHRGLSPVRVDELLSKTSEAPHTPHKTTQKKSRKV